MLRKYLLQQVQIAIHSKDVCLEAVVFNFPQTFSFKAIAFPLEQTFRYPKHKLMTLLHVPVTELKI